MSNSYDGLARMLVLNVGGKANVTSVSHCETRLRFVLKDEGQANTELIKSLDGVVSVIKEDGQYQIVIGNHVPEVYESVLVAGKMQELGISATGTARTSAGAGIGMSGWLIGIVIAIAVELVLAFGVSLPQYISIPAALVGGVVCALILGGIRSTRKKSDGTSTSPSSDETKKILQEKLSAPVKGRIIPLDQLDDDAFASGVLGEGVGFIPEEGRIYAPCSGEITTFFPTGHAIGIRSDSGAEILIHTGIGTVKLDGKGFYPQKKQGDHTGEGELLLEFDLDVIKDAGLSTQTPMIITNSADYSRITVAREGVADHGDTVIETFPK